MRFKAEPPSDAGGADRNLPQCKEDQSAITYRRHFFLTCMRLPLKIAFPFLSVKR